MAVVYSTFDVGGEPSIYTGVQILEGGVILDERDARRGHPVSGDQCRQRFSAADQYVTSPKTRLGFVFYFKMKYPYHRI